LKASSTGLAFFYVLTTLKNSLIFSTLRLIHYFSSMVIVVMGVSGSGKSTIGKLLAERLMLPFFDADDFHTISNIEKMKSGQSLNDKDRAPWLKILADNIDYWLHDKGAVLACSALKNSYRSILGESNTYIYLQGSFELIYQRLQERSDHFMPESLLRSQFDTLEVPTVGHFISIADTVENIVNSALEEIQKHGH
jgi:carbohydrate kinase (thermoresistant glucokinase family)